MNSSFIDLLSIYCILALPRHCLTLPLLIALHRGSHLSEVGEVLCRGALPCTHTALALLRHTLLAPSPRSLPSCLGCGG